MKKAVIIIGIVAGVLAVLAIGGIIFIKMSLPKKAAFSHLTQPRIIKKDDVQALKVDFDGDANVVIKAAYGKLFQTYFGLKNVPKGKNQPAPLARYEGFDDLLDNVVEEKLKDIPWSGFVAIPVPESITALNEKALSSPYPVRLQTLHYGLVAEVVHFGPYENEKPVIDNLKQFITDQGYTIDGLHEEEYIVGPGLPFVGPKDYITIIRYQVKPL